MATNKHLDLSGLQHFYEKLQTEFAPIQAIIFKQTVDDIAHLPALNAVNAGWMYNIKTGGLTTPDFVEGESHIVADGENITAVELLTGVYTQVSPVDPAADPKALGWYEVNQINYVDVTASLNPNADPAALGLYEEDTSTTPVSYVPTADNSIVGGKSYFEKEVTYKLSQDRLPEASKDYFTADMVMKWNLMGGVFDLEDRYLEFGNKFPADSRVVDGRTFLYMGEDTKIYTKVTTPSGRPDEDGYFELDSATAVVDVSTIYNPKQQGLYEEEHVNPSDPTSAVFYVHSADVAYDNTKTYYQCAFVASTDITINPAKIYYTEGNQYKKAVIYQYDSTVKDWIAQSSGGEGGTSDYEDLANLPKVNGVQLVGDKSLEDLGIESLTNAQMDTLLSVII